MSGFSFAGALPVVPDQPLKDAPRELLQESAAGYEGEMTLDGIKLTLDAGARGRVEALKDRDDEDEEGVFGEPRADDSDYTVRLDPLLRADGVRAWTKYRFKAGGKVSVGAQWSALGVSLDAGKGFIFADYHAHPLGASAREAVVSDLSRLRLATRAEDALALDDGDALAFQTSGRLSAGVSLNWSDVLTAGLSGLTGLVAAGTTLSVRVSPSASVDFKASLSDDFRVVFTKTKAGDGVRVSVLKSETRETSLKASLGVSAEFADPRDAERYLTQLVEAVAGGPASKVDALFAEFATQTSLTQLPEPARTLAEALAARLGWTEVVGTVGELEERWAALKESVAKNVAKAARAKVEAGFAYEYLRVSSEDTLLDVDLPRADFLRLHAGLVAGYLKDATDWARDHQDALHKYLRRNSTSSSHAWGFTLGVGPWGINLKGQDRIEKTLVVQENVEGFQRVAYNGLRGYRAQWLGDTFEWAADFKAQTPDFSTDRLPTTCDFEYGVSFNWGWNEKSLNEDELRGLLDHAVIWRAVAAEEVEAVVGGLAGRLGAAAEVNLELTIDDDALRPLLEAVLAGDAPSPNHKGLTRNDVLAARALAAAMPLWEPYAARREPRTRRVLYAPLWAAYFRDDEQTPRDYAKTAGKLLPAVAGDNRIDLQGLSAREGALAAQPDLHTFAGQIFVNSDGEHMESVHRSWLSFVDGLKRLGAAARPDGCVSYRTNVLADVFDRLKGFWSQALYLRAAGVYLLGLASTVRGADGGLLVKRIRRTLTIRFAEGGGGDEEGAVIFSSSV